MSKPEKPRDLNMDMVVDGFLRSVPVVLKADYDKAVNALRSLMGFEPFQGLEPNRASEVLRELGELE